MIDLKTICEEKQSGLKSIKDSDIIKSLAKFEDTVNDAYRGRLFFELIQNARDAAHKAGINSKIIICIHGNTVYVGNTGAPFDEKGIIAMTRLGVSDKSDNKTIGHKGIGFKAIQEYSSIPKIITKFGSIAFDKTKLHEILQKKFPGEFTTESKVPLFYYPHYEDNCIEDIGIDTLKDCETVIMFDLNKGKTPAQLIDKFKEISNEELILLENIESICFQSNVFNKTTRFSYKENEVTVNGNETFEIIRFPQPVLIPNDLYEKLSEKEKELFESDREVDLKIVFRLDNELPVYEVDSELYLFYPLEMKSGFSYKIHSYFSCNPQRTSIIESPRNDFIFEKIVELQISHVFPYLKAKDKKKELLQFAFFKEENKKLSNLYNSYIAKLKSQKFIWIEHENDYYNPNEIMLCDNDAYIILKDHPVNNKKLLVVDDIIAKWLRDKFKVSELTELVLHAQIEAIAETEKSKPSFFEKL
ncbi:hypothetical protein EZS27_027745 [termite gut metagenome]|uniref:ATP-binding protein n=1 Tax=termite gut metagenome TaxID=433724 RepID=A0A5J4QQ39_9ZZZZ